MNSPVFLVAPSAFFSALARVIFWFRINLVYTLFDRPSSARQFSGSALSYIFPLLLQHPRKVY